MPKSGQYYVKEAMKHGLKVANGKGDHVKIYGPASRGYMVIPLKRELANGTECCIKKWFRALGILLMLTIATMMMMGVL